MATRKSTTRGKTKTTKTKTVSKSRNTAARSTKSTASTKPVKVQAATVSTMGIRRVLIFASIIYAGLAAAAGFLMNNATYQLTLDYLTKDELLSRANTVLVPASRVVYDLEIKWVVVALMVLSLVLPILYLTRMERRYNQALKGRVIPWRWIDIGITSALMVETIALLSGIQSLMALKLIAGLMAVAAILGWVSERQNENAAGQPVWSGYVAGLVSCVLAWLVILGTAVSTYLFGMVRSPWFVYALYAVGIIGLGLMALNLLNQHRRKGNLRSYPVVERKYLLLNAATKAAFALVLIAGFLKK